MGDNFDAELKRLFDEIHEMTTWRLPFQYHPQLEAEIRTEQQRKRNLVTFNSPELACLHEAGHAETALSVGASVVEMELYREVPRSYGRTRVEGNDSQRRHIALGGFAVEYLLFKAGRLVKQDSQVPTEKEFIDFAIDNASDDRISYFGGDSHGPDGCWPVGLDRESME